MREDYRLRPRAATGCTQKLIHSLAAKQTLVQIFVYIDFLSIHTIAAIFLKGEDTWKITEDGLLLYSFETQLFSLQYLTYWVV